MRTLVFALTGIFFLIFPAFAEDQPVRSIENITGGLYMFTEANTHGVFLVTDEGIILVDPISKGNATWLKGELDRRFGVPVKYVIYSHDHADHTTGGEVFEDTAQFVAQENAKPKIAENGHTPVPNRTFYRNFWISLGNGAVALNHYYQDSHSDNLTGVYFPNEKVLFLVDIVGVNRLPYRFLDDFNFEGVIDSLTYFSKKDFNILIPGHGPIGEKKDLINSRTYVLDLLREVLKAKQTGKPLAEARTSILLSEYKGWEHYDDWREENIAGAYKAVEEQGLLEEYKNDKLVFPFSKSNPVFPSRAAIKNICGWVIVTYDVDEKGKTRNLEVTETSGTEIFNSSAMSATKKSRYAPGFPGKGIRTRIGYELAGVCEP